MSDKEQSKEIENFIKKEKSLKKRVKYLLENENLSDFKCLVGVDGPEQRAVPCHKFVFAITSYEFYNLFHNLSSKETVIQLPEICYTSFKQFVRYVYTEEITLNHKNIVEIWTLSRRFQIDHLSDFCSKETRRILQQNEDVNLIHQILKNSFMFRSVDSKFLLSEVIGKNPLKFLNSSNIGALRKNELETILKTGKSEAKETDYFQTAILWAKNKISNKDLSDDGLGLKLRGHLQESVKLIRFPLMSYDEFHACLKEYEGFLTNDEIFQIIFFIKEMKGNTIFPKGKRDEVKETVLKPKSTKKVGKESSIKEKPVRIKKLVESQQGTSKPVPTKPVPTKPNPLKVLFIGSTNFRPECLNKGNYDSLSIRSDKVIKFLGVGVQFGLNIFMIDKAQIEFCLRDRMNIAISSTVKVIDHKRPFPEDRIIRNDKYFLNNPVILQANVPYELTAEIRILEGYQNVKIGIGIPNVTLGMPFVDDGVTIHLNELVPNYFITEILYEKI